MCYSRYLEVRLVRIPSRNFLVECCSSHSFSFCHILQNENHFFLATLLTELPNRQNFVVPFQIVFASEPVSVASSSVHLFSQRHTYLAERKGESTASLLETVQLVYLYSYLSAATPRLFSPIFVVVRRSGCQMGLLSLSLSLKLFPGISNMPIFALPEDTRRLLGSALVITSPIFLVKELLDNALDAGATTVDILISPNTVDRVEVRDNGSGISPSDFHHLGRPGHTSKLSSLKDLESVGCKSLGFRGVALASAAALAGIAICTRTPAESVATILHFSREGVAAARGHKPAPAGTSVCVTDLFGVYPVRHKRAISEATATVLKVKGLLECYALARPQVKLSFKVLGGKQSWSYVPTSGAALKDAVVQVMGRELAAQCMLQTSPFPVSDTETKIPQTCSLPLAQQPSKFVFEAYLPTTTADIRKICKRPFISVDSRPLSFTQGTAKKLKAVFEKHFKEFLIPENSLKLPGSPFIRLNIRCPLGSYDPNVEPSKYDVLFHNEELVLREFESFLLSIYPAKRNDAYPSSMDLSTEANGYVDDTGVADEHISTPQVSSTAKHTSF